MNNVFRPKSFRLFKTESFSACSSSRPNGSSIIALLLEGDSKETIKSKISADYKKLIEEIQENSSIQIIVKAKNDEAILELLNDLLFELKELNNLKKIESLEKELINNLDEHSYSKLIKLKSQLNRE